MAQKIETIGKRNKIPFGLGTDPVGIDALRLGDNTSSFDRIAEATGQSPTKSQFPDPVQTEDDSGFNFTEVAPILSSGLASAGNAPATTSAGEGVAHALKSGATGAVTGALAGAKLGAIGGPAGAAIGGVLGLALGGVDAFFKVKNSRKQARAARKMQKSAREANEKALAEARKWQKINRMDTLEQARRDLAKQKAQNRWTNYNNQKGRMTSILNSNMELANNFRKMLRTA